MAPQARVAELVDAHDSKSCSARSGGSIPSTGTSLRCFAATAGRPAVLTSMKQSVGWVERSETHHPSQHDNAAEAMGFTSFYLSYALHGTNKLYYRITF